MNILSPTSCFWKKSKSKSEMGATVSLLLSYPPDLLMKESSGRQGCRPLLSLHSLQHTFKGTLGNGACVLCPKVIVMHGYSHAPQVTDIAGHIISRREVNELHPCVLAVCQYKIVFHFACLLKVAKDTQKTCTKSPDLIDGFGSDLLKDILSDGTSIGKLKKIKDHQLTDEQREEWESIGKLIFEWCCAGEKMRV